MKHSLRLITLFTVLLFFGGHVWGQSSPIDESFSNLGPYGGYQTETWTGDDGGTWSATDARTDQTINGKAICIRNGDLTSPSVLGGIGSLTVTTQRVFSGGSGNLTIKVNSSTVGTIPYSDTEQTNSILNIDISGDIVVVIETPGNGDRIAIDDLQWTAYSGGSTPTISVDPSSLTGFTYVLDNGPSDELTFTVEGTNLTADISLTAPTNYEISETSGSGYTSPITLTQTGGSVASTTIYVRLKAGLSTGTYNGEDITCSSTGATDETVTCDGEVTDGSVTEDFANFPETGSSYASGTFIGQDGSTWTYTDCRGDQTITDETPCLRNNSTANVYSGTISDGIGTISFDYKQAFSTNVNLDVLVNDQVFGTVTSSGEEGITKNSGNISVNVSGVFVIKFQQNTSVGGQVSIDNVTWTGYSGGGNTPPSISNIIQTPATGITSSTTVSVTADVTDSDGTVAGVELHWGTASGSLGNTINMSVSSGDTYVTDSDIPAQAGGTTVYYEIYALDNDSGEATSDEQSYIVISDEPSNHPSGFLAVANSDSEITVSWTDSDADSYLIKGSDVSYAAINDPVDGTPESNGTLVQNVNSGAGTFQFTGLSASTTYYFKIFPYNGTGGAVNYKTDETVEQATATTNAYSGSLLIISEVTDPADEADAKYVELYNSSESAIDITGWQIRRYANGSTSSSDVDLSGTIDAGNTLTVAYNTTFDATYGFTAEIYSGFISGNGDDVYELFDGSNVVDIYGEVGVDGTGEPWEYENSKAVRKNTITSPNATWTASEWNIITSCDALRMTPGMHPVTAWNGSAAKSNAWDTEGNWDNGLPGNGISVFIPSGLSTYPTLSAPTTIEDIVLKEGVTLVGQENLTINGTAYVEKSFTGYTGNDDGWYAISAPVSEMDIAVSDFEPVENEDDFYVYDQNTNYWLNYYDNSNQPGIFDQFEADTGYLVAYHPNNAGTKTFAGTDLNKTSVSPIVSNSNTAWNLSGNPYCSKVTWADVTKSNVSSPKVLSPTTGEWQDLGTELEVGQGVFVYAENGSASLTFETADQTHGSTKKSGEYSGFVKLLAGFDNEKQVQILLQANENASQNYEWEYDARYFYPVTSIPYFCAITKDDIWVSKYVFNSKDENSIIPIRFTVQEEREISFSIGNFETNFGISKLTIEDTKLNEFAVLSDGKTYAFTATPDDDPFRFKLHAEAGTAIYETTIQGLNIYTHNNSLYLSSDVARDADVELYNVTGQLFYGQQVVMAGLTRINPNLKTGWYVVKVSTGEGMASEKVFIK